MKPLVPYLFFNGNCREALDFYRQCFGGELQLMTYDDAPQNKDEAFAKGAKDQIMHGSLTNDTFALMASDWPNNAEKGNNVHLNINCETVDEIEKLFTALSNGGKTVQALSDTFWGSRFGMLVDKFGIHWMLNCSLRK